MLKRLVMVVCSLADFGICLRASASASASGADFYSPSALETRGHFSWIVCEEAGFVPFSDWG